MELGDVGLMFATRRSSGCRICGASSTKKANNSAIAVTKTNAIGIRNKKNGAKDILWSCLKLEIYEGLWSIE